MHFVDGSELLVRFLKYCIEGAVVAAAAYAIPGHNLKTEEVLLIALIAAVTFSALDLFVPTC
jgi:hypothetical protein